MVDWILFICRLSVYFSICYCMFSSEIRSTNLLSTESKRKKEKEQKYIVREKEVRIHRSPQQ